MESFRDIIESFRSISFPSDEECDLSAEDHINKLKESWTRFTEQSDLLVKKSIVFITKAKASPDTRFLRKLVKHLEKCRSLGIHAEKYWSSYDDYRKNKDAGIIEIIWVLFGGKSSKDKLRASDRKKLLMNTKKGEKDYDNLIRERELLLIELDAM